MKIYISADIEGIAGVVAPQHGQPGNPEYERARRLMTEEVNAAIDGAFAGGAAEVLVNDGHGPMLNLLPELIDPRAELILGKPKPANMFAGLGAEHAGVMCVGFHAGAGEFGVLAHTTNGAAFRAVRLNGTACSEATLYGAYAGALGVPVILISGDDATATSCGALFPVAQRVVVKQALGQRAARAVAPARAREMLRDAAATAVRDAARIAPFRIAGPYRLELDLATPALADLAAIIPVAERPGPITVAFAAETMAQVLGWLNTVSALAAFLR
ncbi:D-aminopeptidase [Rhodovastum atsumiense]|uniref:M55 family metallopeptidase n=1 Tax=Rhodovastum atsumiense TaxID=504468 RepID=A0A5M6IUP2_9PROT|nr:M55 family metallopeptidase [Rhodovastum atsumiense]KAA5611278.1 M55 family metallopeptidase [Rhodovastum atsumiense]CAH2601742.1 D-aminopeptidase [Rhodovastum atsumiense]